MKKYCKTYYTGLYSNHGHDDRARRKEPKMYTNSKNETFSLNQIVKGCVCGNFVIIGFALDLAVEPYAILKEYDPKTGKVARGQLALSVEDIKYYC